MRTNSTVKASLFTLILALLAIGTIAIAEVMKEVQPIPVEKAVLNTTWYFTAADDDNPENAANYSTEPLEGKPCGERDDVVCEIEAPANSAGQPNMSAMVGTTGQSVQARIAQAVNSSTTNETVQAFREE